MSYCRFSSDNWKSEVYVYANVSGAWTIHVAGNKIVGDVPEEDLSFLSIKDRESPEYKAAIQRFTDGHKAALGFLATASRCDLTLPHAGETFDTASPGDCADKLEELAALGYHIPAGVIDDLRAEQRGPNDVD